MSQIEMGLWLDWVKGLGIWLVFRSWFTNGLWVKGFFGLASTHLGPQNLGLNLLAQSHHHL